MIRDILRPDYRAHAALVDPARPTSQLWRLFVGFLLLCIGLAISLFLALSVVLFFTPIFQEFTFIDQQSTFDLDPDLFLEESSYGNTAGEMFHLLLNIALLIPVVALIASALHGRRLSSIIGPGKLALKQFVGIVLALIVLDTVVTFLPPYSSNDGSGQTNLDFELWLVLLPLSMFVVLLQCAAEEIVFRGYFQQQLAARFKNKAIWLIIPSTLFGVMHYNPDAGSNAIAFVASAVFFGILMADLTARAGTLGPAIAIHFVNNFMAILLFASADELNGLALYTLPFGLGDEDAIRILLVIDLFYMSVSWLVARLVLRR
ncbi:MAG: CPBP family intramembrane glutamic endopeptidase [Paracoccaceae bacterium]